MHRKSKFLVLIVTLVFSILACNMPYLQGETATTPAPTDAGFQAPTQEAGAAQPTDSALAATEQPGEEPLQQPPVAGAVSAKRITIASTEELSKSGLLDLLINGFRQSSGYDVVVELGGSGRAFRLGRKYVADILLVNNAGNVIEFIAQGDGKERFQILHTDYVILGAPDDPAGIKNAASAADAFKKIAAAQEKFITRGTESDLVSMENRIWKAAGVTPSGNWYTSATTNETSSGNPGTLKLASDAKAYTLMDRATYLEYHSQYPLELLYQGDTELFDIYYAVPVNPEKSDKINYAAAQAFVQYLASPEIQALIAQFGTDKYGQPIFFADGGKSVQ
jgi:tungstate transport system substrate-binding protein